MDNFPDLVWVNSYLHLNLEPSKIHFALSFVILWNLFEHEIFDDKFDSFKIEEKIKNYHLTSINFNDEFNYFRSRSRVYNGDNYIKYGLREDNPKKRVLIELLLNETAENDIEKIKALIYIIYRIRNNMFHGPKSIMELPNQEENFRICNSVIKKILESKSNIVK